MVFLYEIVKLNSVQFMRQINTKYRKAKVFFCTCEVRYVFYMQTNQSSFSKGGDILIW